MRQKEINGRESRYAFQSRAPRIPIEKGKNLIKSIIVENSCVADTTNSSFMPSSNSTMLPKDIENKLSEVSSDIEVLTVANLTIDSDSEETEESEEKVDEYGFDMLDTDDSTDEEEDYFRKPKKRPPPPKWALPENRRKNVQKQAKIQQKFIDSFFGEPQQVDLRELFPAINEINLKRRESSYKWSTPRS